MGERIALKLQAKRTLDGARLGSPLPSPDATR
jgi:hypothetical protein